MASGIDRSDPYPAYRFGVLLLEPGRLEDLAARGISSADLAGGLGFAEVSGLEVSVGAYEYREGGMNDRVHLFPGSVTPVNLVLRRGLDASTQLWEWVESGSRGSGGGAPAARAGVVVLQDAAGAPVRAWSFRDAIPVRWSGPQLDALGERLAMERLELAHGGLRAVPVR